MRQGIRTFLTLPTLASISSFGGLLGARGGLDDGVFQNESPALDFRQRPDAFPLRQNTPRLPVAKPKDFASVLR